MALRPRRPAAPPQASAELSPRRRYLVLGICCSSLFLVGLDNTILNVALPALQRDLHASVAGLQWTIDAYVIVLASLLLLAGSMGDRFGRRRVFRTGLVLFSAGSLLCSIAPSLGWLIGFRALQAVGGSMLNPVAVSIITNTFTEPRERARAIGVWGAIIGLSLAAGPVLGGLLVDQASWRAIFWINVPVGLAAFVLTRLYVPESRAARARRFDPVGQVLLALSFGALVYALIEAPSAGWVSARTLGTLAAVAVGLAAFAGWSLRRADPVLDMRFFRSPPFSGATLIAVSAFVALGGFLFLNTLYLQDVRGFSALHAGLFTLPMAAVTAVAAPVSGRLVGAYGPRPSLLISGPCMAVSGALLTVLGPDTGTALLFVAYALFGLGFGMVNAPITTTAVAGLPNSQAGVAAAVASTSRQLGQALGVAVIGSIAASKGLGGTQVDPTDPAGWWIIAGCGAVVALLGLVTTGPWALRHARHAAARMAAAPTSTAAIPAASTPAASTPAASTPVPTTPVPSR